MYIRQLVKTVRCISISIKPVSYNCNGLELGSIYKVSVTTDPNHYFVHSLGIVLPSDMFMDIDEWRDEVIDSLLN